MSHMFRCVRRRRQPRRGDQLDQNHIDCVRYRSVLRLAHSKVAPMPMIEPQALAVAISLFVGSEAATATGV